MYSDKLLGGEIAMWTDQYCETRQCWDEPNWEKRTNAPRAYWMFAPQHDKEFSQSLLGMVSLASFIDIVFKKKNICVCTI